MTLFVRDDEILFRGPVGVDRERIVGGVRASDQKRRRKTNNNEMITTIRMLARFLLNSAFALRAQVRAGRPRSQ
jgi:hypothetical protein